MATLGPRLLISLFALLLPALAAACPPLLKHSFPRLQDSSSRSLCEYHGKVLLVVNTASYCGYTGQYEGLEALHEKYASRGLVILGFPSNDFGQQEPGSNTEIAEFCRMTYGVKFPMMAKTDIAAPKTHPFFRQLIAAAGAAPAWNFHKYLIDRSGQRVASFDSKTAPNDPRLLARIERWLAEKP